jgi:hypothetical protein
MPIFCDGPIKIGLLPKKKLKNKELDRHSTISKTNKD